MRYVIILLLALVLTANVKIIWSEEGDPHTGHVLLRKCKAAIEDLTEDQRIADAGQCTGYVHGIEEMLRFIEIRYGLTDSLFCVPKGVNLGQMARVVVKYLEDHPERLHETDINLVVDAFKLAFPCKN
jgi:hypothetical protein